MLRMSVRDEKQLSASSFQLLVKMQKQNQSKKMLEPKTLKLTASGGFTLMEMIVSIALFSFVMLAATTVLLSVIDANHKAQGLKNTINNLSLSLESIARNLRTGSAYIGLAPGAPCPSNGFKAISYTNQDGLNTIYQITNSAIEISRNGGSFTKMTSPEVLIDRLCFYISGTSLTDTLQDQQPTVLITVGGTVSPNSTAGVKLKTRSRFDIETFITQRLPDVPRS